MACLHRGRPLFPHVPAALRYNGIAAALLLSAAVFASTGSSYGQTPANDPVIAKVDGVEIVASDLDLAAQVFGNVSGMDEKERHDFLVQYLIDIALMSKEARKQNLTLDEKDLQRRLDFVRNKALMERLLGKTAQDAITDAAVRKAYDEAVKEITAEPEVRLRSMTFKVDDGKDEKAVKAAEAKAEEAVRRIKSGEDFAKVAEEMTGHSSPNSFLEAGYMTRQQMGREFAQVAFDLEIGGVSAPIKTAVGWHVIKVEDRRTRKPPEFETVRDRFVVFVGRKAQLDMMQKLRAQAKIERLDKAGQAAETATGAAK